MAKSKATVRLDDAKLQQMIKDSNRQPKTYYIADGVEYGVFNELGTSRIAARPFMVPAFEAGTKGLDRKLEQAIEQGVSLDDVMSKTAFDIQTGAQRNIQDKNIIDTGALLNSIHVTNSEPS